MRTNVYIDGFNLFYGCLKGSPYKWLNLEALFDTLLPRNQIQRIRYFTARVESRPPDPDQPTRQATYLRALATLPRVEVHFGSFLTSVIKAPLVQSNPDGSAMWANNKPMVQRRPNGGVVMDWVYKSEEKGSDVNLAAHLLRDAFKGDCESAVIVSNDSDLLTPISMAKTDCGLKIGLILPRQHGSVELRRLSDFQKDIRKHQLLSAQFPPVFNDGAGTILRPAGW